MPYYKSAEPNSKRSSYKPNENVDFTLNFQGQQIKTGSVRLCGKLVVDIGDPQSEDTQYDALTGVHGFIQAVVCEFEKFGVTENLDGVGRLVKMKSISRQNDGQASAESSSVTSLVLARDNQTNCYIKGSENIAGVNFACPLDCIVNRANKDIPHSRVGDIRISIRLASALACVINANNDGYEMTDLELTYLTEDEDKSTRKEAVVCEVFSMVKHTINSSVMSLNSQVPNRNVLGVACSFIPVADENVDAKNNLDCNAPPDITRLVWNFNDSFNRVSYEILQREDMLYNFVRAMGNTGTNFIRCKKLNEDEHFGIGLDLGEPVDLRNQKLGMVLDSGVSSASPYSMFLYIKAVKAF